MRVNMRKKNLFKTKADIHDQRRSQGEVLRVLGPPLGTFMGPILRGPGIA